MTLYEHARCPHGVVLYFAECSAGCEMLENGGSAPKEARGPESGPLPNDRLIGLLAERGLVVYLSVVLAVWLAVFGLAVWA